MSSYYTTFGTTHRFSIRNASSNYARMVAQYKHLKAVIERAEAVIRNADYTLTPDPPRPAGFQPTPESEWAEEINQNNRKTWRGLRKYWRARHRVAVSARNSLYREVVRAGRMAVKAGVLTHEEAFEALEL